MVTEVSGMLMIASSADMTAKTLLFVVKDMIVVVESDGKDGIEYVSVRDEGNTVDHVMIPEDGERSNQNKE